MRLAWPDPTAQWQWSGTEPAWQHCPGGELLRHPPPWAVSDEIDGPKGIGAATAGAWGAASIIAARRIRYILNFLN